MTKENKLALVVGFGLVLFVGILISDHFSTARRQEAADLLPASNALADVRRNDRDLIDLAPETPAAPPLASHTTEIAPAPAGSSDVQPIPSNPDQTPVFVAVNDSAGEPVRVVDQQQLRDLTESPKQSPLPTHMVQSGETLFSICREHYGDGALAEKLAVFNSIKDPAALREGHRLQMPTVDELRGKGGSSPSASPANAKPSSSAVAMIDYTLQEGDTLAKVARKLGGSRVTWNDLYDLNKSVIDDPDNVQAGITIKVPRRH